MVIIIYLIIQLKKDFPTARIVKGLIYYLNLFDYIYIYINMDDNIKELIIDYTIGETSYWKHKFSDVLDDIQIHNPEMFVCTCFCDMYNNFLTMRLTDDGKTITWTF